MVVVSGSAVPVNPAPGYVPDMTRELNYRKSSYSGGDNGSQCVEVRSDLGAIRDSKNATGPALRVPAGALAGLVALTRR